jgi:hypothetical protein
MRVKVVIQISKSFGTGPFHYIITAEKANGFELREHL